MRICQITDGAQYYPPEGADTPSWETHRLSVALSEQGHEVHVILLPDATGRYPYWTHSVGGFISENVYLNKIIFGVKFPAVYQALNQSLGFEIIHFHSPIPIVLSSYRIGTCKKIVTWGDPGIARRQNGSSVLDAVMTGSPSQAPPQTVSFAIQRLALRNVDKVIVVSEALRSALTNVHKVPHSKINVIPPGVDTDLFRPRSDTSELRKYLKVPSDGHLILCPARIGPLKSQLDLIDAIPLMAKHLGRLSVILLGHKTDALYFRRIVDRARALGVLGSLIITGVVPPEELPMYYAVSDVVTLPSIAEGLPSSLLEAMSCGKPIVATNIPGNLEAAQLNRGALWVPVHRPDLLADKIIEAVESSEVKSLARAQGREIAKQKFSWKEVAAKTIRVYEEVVARA